jgi:phosphoribosyl-ATP pyrophosphohydrolase/phosphoribosyl-AMP cyclohydrolase
MLNPLTPAIVQSSLDGSVLMLGYMNEDAVEETKRTGLVTFWSRSKNRLWQKGESSGNVLRLKEIFADCDQDAFLILAEPAGPTCHTGEKTCFGQDLVGPAFLSDLFQVIQSRKKTLPENSYTTELFQAGLPLISAKIEEESEEVGRAAREETPERVAEEAADLLYHLMVLLVEQEVGLEEVIKVLRKRKK